MARPDFSLLWSKNNTPDPIADADYEAGWSFVGSQPPRRSEFDFFQRKINEQTNWIASQIPVLSDVGVVFDSVADMKASDDVFVGQKVRTLGYYSPGGGGNDYEIVAAGTGVDDGGSYINLTTSNLQAKALFPDGYVNALQFGCVADGVADNALYLTAARDYCVSEKKNLYFPSGTYNVDEANWPFKQNNVPVTELLNFNGITVYGDGDATVFQTTSSTGADVLQLNGVANLHFRDFRIESILTGFNDAGSNGISVTNGWDNITVDNVFIGRMPFVDKTTYLDGGKGLTIQPGTPTVECGTLTATNMKVYGCVDAYGIEVDADNFSTKKSGIRIEGVAEKSYRGFKFVATAATTAPSYTTYGVTVDITTKNCQQDIVVNRGRGLDVTCNTVSTESIASLRLDPDGATWNPNDSLVYSVYSVYAKLSRINIIGNKPTANHKLILGGTTEGAGSVGSSDLWLYADISGSALTSDIDIIDSGGNTVNNSMLFLSSNTAASVPASLSGSDQNNFITLGASLKLSAIATSGAYALTDATGASEVSELKYNEAAGYSGLKTKLGATGSLIGGAILNQSDEVVLGARNDGAMVLNSLFSTDVLGAYVGRHPIYDKDGILIGWIPIYS